MRAYPTKIRITRKVAYRVVWVRTFDDPKKYGECDLDSKIITVKLKMSRERTWLVIIHETLHAIEEEYGIPIPHWLIYTIEEPIYKLLTLNKWM